ncbi:kinase [Thraustotheca clavata]|uniref:Kinase n=1 Tax=Thraustotheca clavata TaxID=74557 RepID=A0A1V9YR21_9STRA|nr:kinase [Thraustotheca clavata]
MGRRLLGDAARHSLTKYTTSNRKNLRGQSIDIHGARVESINDLGIDIYLQKPYNQQQVLHLTAPNDSDKEKWIEALTNCANGITSGISKRICHRGVLNGQYILVRELGRGASGVVHLYTCHGKPCAVKRLSSNTSKKATKHLPPKGSQLRAPDRPDGLPDDVKREIAILKKVSNLPHVVSLYDVIHDADNDCVYLVMEFLGGGPIATYNKDTKRFHTKQHLAESDIKRIMRCATVGLKYLHANHLVHRDIKPDNLLLTEDNRECKLADLGVAHFFPPPTSLLGEAQQDAGMLCNTKGTFSKEKAFQMCVGTYEFMSPEALSGEAYSGYAADIWALGVTLYALVCGVLPFQAPNILALFDAIANQPLIFPETKVLSHDLKDLITRMLIKDAHHRITLEDVLLHPWLSAGATKHYLYHSTSPLHKVEINPNDISIAVSPLQMKFNQLRNSQTTTEDLALWSITPSFREEKSASYRPSPINIDNISIPKVLQNDIISIAHQVHFAWCTQKTLEGWIYGNERNDDLKVHPLLKPYHKLDNEAQSRNIASVNASIQCILALGYQIRSSRISSTRMLPISLERITLSGDLIILSDLLAENDHELWAFQYIQNQWSYGKEYNIEKKTHPALLPFLALPESHRNSSRNNALVIIKSLVALKYSIQHLDVKH